MIYYAQVYVALLLLFLISEKQREAMNSILKASYNDKSKVKELQDHAENLRVKRDHIQQKVQQNGTRIDEDVKE